MHASDSGAAYVNHRAAQHAHRAPDPAPIEEPMPEPFDTPHPHHQPGHMPQDEEPVPDHKPS